MALVLADRLPPNLLSPNPGTVIGTVVMAIGLVAGIGSIVSSRRVRIRH